MFYLVLTMVVWVFIFNWALSWSVFWLGWGGFKIIIPSSSLIKRNVTLCSFHLHPGGIYYDFVQLWAKYVTLLVARPTPEAINSSHFLPLRPLFLRIVAQGSPATKWGHLSPCDVWPVRSSSHWIEEWEEERKEEKEREKEGGTKKILDMRMKTPSWRWTFHLQSVLLILCESELSHFSKPCQNFWLWNLN